MREFSGKTGLRHLGVLIARAEKRGVADHVFMVFGAGEDARVPQDMIETQRLRVIRAI